MKNRLVLFTYLWLFPNFLFAQEIDYKPFKEWSWHKQGNTEYYLYTPSTIPVNHKCPIVVFLHGCCGVDDHATPRNCVDPGARVWHNFGENTQPEPIYILSAATSRGWSRHFPDIKQSIDSLIAIGKVDPERVYINGFSMGGAGTWEFINAYPTFFAAAAPMGCTPSGNFENIKSIPIFQNTAQQDGRATPLKVLGEINKIRVLNRYSKSPNTWETGVNPRQHIYEGGHGAEQWMSTQNQGFIYFNDEIWYSDEYDVYQDWMLSKINDGNAYPCIFIESPNYAEKFSAGSTVPLRVFASDDDSVQKVEVYVNKVLQSTITKPQSGYYCANIKIGILETLIEAKAYDNKGKTSTSDIVIRTDSRPSILSAELPNARMGTAYSKRLFAFGNKPLSFKLAYKSDPLPAGLVLSKNGLIKGIPVVNGKFNIKITVSDVYNDSITKTFSVNIRPKNQDEIIITEARSRYESAPLITSKTGNGELPYSNNGTEVNFSSLGVYNGLTFIQTINADVDKKDSTANYLSFIADVPVTVYIAYEKLDNIFISTRPDWLIQNFTKETANEIAVQYYYFDVYSKNYPAGTITLPGSEATKNNVHNNYFVMVKKQGSSLKRNPEITSKILPSGKVGNLYKEQLSSIDGIGKINWKLTKGTLPEGLKLKSDGTLSGGVSKAGIYTFTVTATDFNRIVASKELEIKIDK